MSSRDSQPTGDPFHESVSWQRPNPTLNWPDASSTAPSTNEVPTGNPLHGRQMISVELQDGNNNPRPSSVSAQPQAARRSRSGQAASKGVTGGERVGQTPKKLHASPPDTQEPVRPTKLGRPSKKPLKRPPSPEPGGQEPGGATLQRASKRPQTLDVRVASSSSSTRTSPRRRGGNPPHNTFNLPDATLATQEPITTAPQSNHRLPGPSEALNARAFVVASTVAQPAQPGISLASGQDLFARDPNSYPPGGLHNALAPANFASINPQTIYYPLDDPVAPGNLSMISAEGSVAQSQDNQTRLLVRNERARFQEISAHWDPMLPFSILHESELARIGFWPPSHVPLYKQIGLRRGARGGRHDIGFVSPVAERRRGGR